MISLTQKSINKIIEKLISRTDIKWYELKEITINRGVPQGFNGSSHAYYSMPDGFLIKISKQTFKPNSFHSKHEQSSPKEKFETITLTIEDLQKRFGRSQCLQGTSNKNHSDWRILNKLLDDIQQRPSTQQANSLPVLPIDTALSRIADIL